MNLLRKESIFPTQESRKPLQISLVAQMVKRLSTMRETSVQSLGLEVPWRRKWQSTPVLLPRKSHGQKSLVSMGLQRIGHYERLHFLSLYRDSGISAAHEYGGVLGGISVDLEAES